MAPRKRAFKPTPPDQYVTKLALFAREFQLEDRLRRVVADLLTKMGHKGVRITHGPNEKGKDIVFKAPGPLGEMKLFACVVKNTPITGQAEDLISGAPTIVHRVQQGVLNQIQQAFNEPLPNGRGADELVDGVYVISPYECPTTAIDSVKASLQRSGQIRFVCGRELLELFADHWPEFLWFESSVLLSHLSALRKGLQDDYALAGLILRKSFLAASPSGLADLYVEPRFHRELKHYQCSEIPVLNLRLLEGTCRLAEIDGEVRRLDRLSQILQTSEMWAEEVDAGRILEIAAEVISTAKALRDLWEQGYQRFAAKAAEDARRSGQRRGQQDFARTRFSGDSSVALRTEAAVEMLPSVDFKNQASDVQQSANESVKKLQRVSAMAGEFAVVKHVDALNALGSTGFLTYCQLSDTAKLVPFAFGVPSGSNVLNFEESLLDQFAGPLLITGPAGYGKTTLCRWHAIRDASRLVDKEAAVLPVYVALHPLSQGKLGSFEEVFFRSDELRKLIQIQSEGQSPFERVRLYLDGLDEVTSVPRQRELMQLAEWGSRKWPFLQVIATGRDHVIGSWLRWLPRVRLSPLGGEKIHRLAEKWLEADRVDGFFSRLREVENLTPLMETPLLATLILALYRKTGTVPPNKTNLYSLFVELLCGGWDFYKNIQRRENRFSIKDKTVVLTRLAGILQLENKRDATDSDFKAALKNTFVSFMPDCDQLLQEIVEDGLLIRIGTDFTFSHLSFQEFLAGKDLHDPTGNRSTYAMNHYFNGEDWWREPLAFYVTMSDRPAEIDEWILKRALLSKSTVVDLASRAEYLRKAVVSSYPAYKPSADAGRLSVQVARKAKNLSGKETISLSLPHR